MSFPLASPLAKDLLRTTRPHAMLHAGMRLLVAVSGGADSVALLGLLRELAPQQGWVIEVAHFDHQLRAESAAEATFTRRLAEAYGFAFHLGQPAVRPGRNLEAWARQQRYAYFHRLLEAGVADVVATAHTREDQAETVLLRLMRGTGTAGLAGILPVLVRVPGCPQLPGSGPRVIRPALGLARRAMREWLAARQQNWCEDPSNAWLSPRRNWVRHRLLPQLAAELNPRIVEVLASTAGLAAEEEAWWRDVVVQAGASLWRPVGDRMQAGVAELRALPRALRLRVLRAAIQGLQGNLLGVGFEPVHQLSTWVEESSHRTRKLAFAAVTAEVNSRTLSLASRLSEPERRSTAKARQSNG